MKEAQILLDRAEDVSKQILNERAKVVWEEELLSSGEPWAVQADLGQLNLMSTFPGQPELVDFLKLQPNDYMPVGASVIIPGIGAEDMISEYPALEVHAGPARVDGAVHIYVRFLAHSDDLLELCKRKGIPYKLDELKAHYGAAMRRAKVQEENLRAMKELMEKYQ